MSAPLTRTGLVSRSLRHYWRSNVAVVVGVAIAVSVLAGALVVGESVKASLRALAVSRLGRTDHLIASTGFFRAAFVDELRSQPAFRQSFREAAGLIAIDALVTHASNGRRASGVALYGVDDRFWAFHGQDRPALGPREALLSTALARELNAAGADGVLVRLQQPSAIPASTLHGRREELGRTLRASVASILPDERLGGFSLRPHQGEVKAIFVPLARLQRDLDQIEKLNAVLVSQREDAAGGTSLATLVETVRTLEDSGLRLRNLSVMPPVPVATGTAPSLGPSSVVSRPLLGLGEREPSVAIESDAGLIPEPVERAADRVARDLGMAPLPVYAYLAESIGMGEGRDVAYSVVAGIDLPRAMTEFYRSTLGSDGQVARAPLPAGNPIWFNAWMAEALRARVGEPVTVTYEVWEDGGGISRRSERFTLAGIVSMLGVGADPTLTPDYPGISDQTSVADWDPPFPIDLSRVTPRDEAYWDRYKAAPKAFIPYDVAVRLWGSRFGRMTSLRLRAPDGQPGASIRQEVVRRLRAGLPTSEAGFLVQPVRERALAAASGTTDFGQYFVYFSFFLVIAGLLLAGLFFRVGVEQRLREIGLLEAVGLTPRAVRGLFVREGFLLALVGSVLGIAGAIAYASIIMLGLRTWWVGAVGTTALVVTPSAMPLVVGALAGLLTATLVIAWSVGQASRAPARSLLKGALEIAPPRRTRLVPRWLPMVLFAALAIVFLVLAVAGAIDPAAGFFGAGGAGLVADLLFVSWYLRRPSARAGPASPWAGLARAGASNARARPGRSVLAVSLIAFATFVIVAVGAFRRGDVADASDRRSGTGGYALIGESVAPLMYDPATKAGAEAYGLDSPDVAATLTGVTVDRFRLRPGDDGSCLNLYRPERPRIIAPTPAFVKQGGRFTFAGSLAASEAERTNPWLLLERALPAGGDAAIPAILDATSLQYVFHRALGDEIEIEGPAGRPLRLHVVGSLSHSLFQSEILISEENFVRLFPANEGYRLWLAGVPRGREDAVTSTLETRLSDFGLEVGSTVERLRAYQQVENTYLSTFQALGGLGLVLGTFGLGAVLVRNVLERRREVALLQAVGYESRHVGALVVSETLWIVVAGVAIGAGSALLAVQPALAAQGGSWPVAAILLVAVTVLAAGLLASLVATRVATRLPLVAALKAE
jgi:ABC-type antimicrobial peptide transport system permease subunit